MIKTFTYIVDRDHYIDFDVDLTTNLTGTGITFDSSFKSIKYRKGSYEVDEQVFFNSLSNRKENTDYYTVLDVRVDPVKPGFSTEYMQRIERCALQKTPITDEIMEKGSKDSIRMIELLEREHFTPKQIETIFWLGREFDRENKAKVADASGAYSNYLSKFIKDFIQETPYKLEPKKWTEEYVNLYKLKPRNK